MYQVKLVLEHSFIDNNDKRQISVLNSYCIREVGYEGMAFICYSDAIKYLEVGKHILQTVQSLQSTKEK